MITATPFIVTLRINTLDLHTLIPDIDRRHADYEVFTPSAKEPFTRYVPMSATLWIVNEEAWVILESGEQIIVPRPGDAWMLLTLLTYQKLLDRIGEIDYFTTADVIPDYAMVWHELGKNPHQVLVHPTQLVELQAYLSSIRQGMQSRA